MARVAQAPDTSGKKKKSTEDTLAEAIVQGAQAGSQQLQQAVAQVKAAQAAQAVAAGVQAGIAPAEAVNTQANLYERAYEEMKGAQRSVASSAKTLAARGAGGIGVVTGLIEGNATAQALAAIKGDAQQFSKYQQAGQKLDAAYSAQTQAYNKEAQRLSGALRELDRKTDSTIEKGDLYSTLLSSYMGDTGRLKGKAATDMLRLQKESAERQIFSIDRQIDSLQSTINSPATFAAAQDQAYELNQRKARLREDADLAGMKYEAKTDKDFARISQYGLTIGGDIGWVDDMNDEQKSVYAYLYGKDGNGLRAAKYREAAVEENRVAKIRQEQAAEAARLQAISDRYKQYQGLADWASRSAYQPKNVDTSTGAFLKVDASDDLTYEVINGNQSARNKLIYQQGTSGSALYGDDYSYLYRLTENEKKTYNYLYSLDQEKGGRRAAAYLAELRPLLNQRSRAETEQKMQRYAQENPVAGSAFSVLTAPLKAGTYAMQFADLLGGNLDQNAGANRWSYGNTAIRNKVSKIVEENWGPAGSFFYQTGMSMADFLFNTAITGGSEALSLGLMGTQAAADTVVEAKDRGLNDLQAFSLGTIAGAAEILTEKVSLETLLDKSALSKNAVGYWLKNVLAEGSEEVGSDLINLVADNLISQGKSEWNEAIRAYTAQGLSRQEAFARAFADKAGEIGLSFAGGALSGGAMAGGGIAVNGIANRVNQNSTTVQDRVNDAKQNYLLAVLRHGENSPEAAQALQNIGQQVYGTALGGVQSVFNDDTNLNRKDFLAPNSTGGTGLVYDTYVRSAMDSTVANRINTVAKDLGVRVEFVDQVRQGTANAQLQDRVVQIEKNNQNPTAFLLGHELGHQMKQSAPEAWSAFERVLPQEYRRKVQDKLDLYTERGETLTEAEALEEVACDYAGELINNTDVLDRFIQQNRGDRTLLQRITDVVRSIAQKLTGAARRQAQTAESRLMNALRESARSLYNTAAFAEDVIKLSAKEDKVRVLQTLRNNLNMLSKMQTITSVDGSEIPSGDRATDRAMSFLNTIGNKVYRRGLGEVLFSRTKVKTGFVGHGFNKAKLDLFAAVPAVVESGEQIDYQKNWDGRNYDSYVFAGPVEYNGSKVFLSVVVVQDKVSNKYYVHEAVDENGQLIYGEEKTQNRLPTGPQQAVGGTVTDSRSNTIISDSPQKSNTQSREKTGRKAFSLKEDVQAKVDRATRMLDNGSTYGEVFKETGLVINLGGEIQDGFDGPVIGRYVRSGNDQGAMVRDEQATRSQADRRENREGVAGDSGPAQQRSWDDLGGRQRQEIVTALTRRMEKATQEGKAFLSYYASEDAFAEAFYDMLHEGRIVAEQWDTFIPGIQGLMDEIDRIVDMPNRQYSLKQPQSETEKLLRRQERENARLREKLEETQRQLQRTTVKMPSVSQMRAEVRAVMRGYGVRENNGNVLIYREIKQLYELMGNGKTTINGRVWELTSENANRLALEIADQVLSRSRVKEDMAEYQDLRETLKGASIHVPQEIRNDLSMPFQDFKRQYGKEIKFSKDGVGIEMVWQELEEQYPGLFDGSEYLNPADMLNHLGEVLDATRPVESNPFEEGTQAWEIERQHLANDILDRFYEIPQQKPTFADKQYRKLMWAKVNAQNKLAEVKAHYEQRVAAERERGNAKAERVKEHYRERDAAAKARKTENQERTQLLKVARRLERLKTTATNRATINEMIGDLDTVAKSITGNTVQRLNALNDWYQDRKANDPDFINDPGVEKSLQRLSKRQISDLSLDEVRELTDALLNIENEIRTEKKLLDTKERRDIYALGEQAIKDINESAGSKGGPVDRFLVTQTLSPVRYFRRMVGYVENSPMMKLVNGLADGQRKMLDYQMRAEKPFETFANDKQFNRDFSGTKAKEIRISGMDGTGKTITLSITPAMRASLYLHSLNSQNLRHIAEGGITVPDMKLYKAGKIAEAYARGQTIRLDPFQVKAIASGMSKQERAFTELVHDYFNGQSRDEINATSEILKGYSLAGVENYFPINTDSSFTRSEFESLKKDGTIEGMGFLKERINAANPIFLRDVNTVLDQSIQMHGKYVGMAIPVRNFQKVWNVTINNYTESGERIAFSASVQQAVRRQWGETAIKYVDKLMGDLQNGSAEKNELIKALNKVRSNYAGAVLTLNLSVAMKQAASYPTAAAVLGWRPLLSAMHNLGHVDLDLIAKYTPLQWYRSKGFSTKELGDLSKTDSLMGKLLSHKVLNWVQGVDLLTTRKLWKASEYYVRQNQKELNVGTDAYYRAVADIYNRVIEETQPNYTTMQRPQLLRSDDSLLGSLQMFKTQPFQNTNILYDAAENLRAKLKQGDKAAIREARKGFSRAVTSQLGQLAVFAGMTFLWALMRGKTDKYKDDKDEITFESVLSALGKDMLGGLAAGVPFGSDAWDLANSKIFGERYYGMDSVTVTAISDTVKSLGKMGDLIGKTVEQVANGDAVNWNQFRITTVKQMNVISKAFGIPLENVVNIYEAITGQVMRAAYGENKGDFYNLLLTKDPKEDTKAYFDILYKALAADDDETYNDLKARLLDGGVVTRDQLWNAMTERFKKDWQADDSLQYNSHLMKEAGVTQEMIADWRRTEFRNAYDKDPSIAEDAAAMSRAGVSEDTIAEWEEAKWKSSGYLEDLQAVGADLDAADKVVRSITKQKGDSKKWKTLEESGLPEDQQEIIMKVFAGKDDLNRWDVFKENGMSLQNFYSVRSRYALVKGDEVMNEKEKPLEFVHWLAQQNFSDKEVDVIRGVFKFDQSATTRYEKFLDAGVAEDDAYEIAGDLAGLKPLTGASSVSDKQRESAIAFGSYTQQTKLKALSAIMDEAKTEKLKGAMSAGIGLDAYMDYYLNASGIKSDEGAKSGGAGSAKQKKMTFIDEIPGLNTEHKDYIYLYVEGWSAKTLGDAPWHGGERYSGELPKHGKVDASTSKAVPTTTEKATSTSTSTARTSGSSSTRSSGSRSSGSRSGSTGTRTASTRVSTAGTTSGSLKARGSTGRATARTAASRIVLPSIQTASTMPSLKINLPEKLKRVVYGTTQNKLKKL